jgi:sugar/nucleoside kinase (ribokinase family)
MSLRYDVIVVGSYSVDLIFAGLPEFPQLGKDVVGTAFEMTPGEAYITAIAMHRLGIKVGWAADFGNDDFSQFTVKHAREEGLDDSLFVIHDRPYRRISAAASFPHERGFITYYDPDPLVPAAIPALIKANARLVFLPGLYFGNFLKLGKRLIQSKRMNLVMDGNSSDGDIVGKDKQCKAIRQAIKSTDIFLPNAREARRITGEQELHSALAILGELCPVVVIKDGANGSFSYMNGKIEHVPAISITPLDTTGAGDNFNAGFLRAWLDGSPIEICQKWGNIAGGLSTTALGGTTRKLTCEIIQGYL